MLEYLISFGGLWLIHHQVCCFHLFSYFSLLRFILLSFGHFFFISFCTPWTVSLLPSIFLYLQLRYRSYNDSQSIFNTISMFSSFISFCSQFIQFYVRRVLWAYSNLYSQVSTTSTFPVRLQYRFWYLNRMFGMKSNIECWWCFWFFIIYLLIACI